MIESLVNLPPELATLLLAMVPVGELRGAIPVAIFTFEMSPWAAYFWSVLGNLLLVVLVLIFLPWGSKLLMEHTKWGRKFFEWLFGRTQRKHSKKFERWGEVALVLFVAIPLPMTGGVTGAVAAFVFGIPKKKALPLLSLGVLIAGVVVLTLSVGINGVI